MNDSSPAESVIEIPSDPIQTHLEPIKRPFIDYKERTKSILSRYKEGILFKDIALEFGISEGRVCQIVKKNESSLHIDREAEKARRLRRLRLAENKAPLSIAPKDTDQLVRVIEAQRKELEGDSSFGHITNNTQININLDSLSPADKWAAARKLLE